MSLPRAAAVAQRQRALLVRSAELRLRLADDAVVLQRPLALADRVHQGWLWLRANPAVPIAVLVVVALLRPRRALRWGLQVWGGWRTLRSVQRRLSALA